MKLNLVDILIIFAYLISTVVIGLVLKKVAQKSKSNYLLGGNKLPWYMLGLSNASGMFDISGTMWLVTLLFVKIELLAGFQAFLFAIYLVVKKDGQKTSNYFIAIFIDQTQLAT